MIDTLDFHTASRRHLLVECSDLATTMDLHQGLETAALEGVEELIPAARTVLIRFNPARTSAPVIAEKVRRLERTGTDSTRSREVTIDVVYDGEDLIEVADLLSLSTAEVVARHQRATWQVAFSGFAPGFGYLAGDDPIFNVPRRSSPRTRVPVGAVALAGEFTGVYPRASPGGWQLIGRTDATLWDLDREPPALFVPGTSVKFREVERESVTVSEAAARADASSSSPADAVSSQADAVSSQSDVNVSGHSFTVVRPGLQLLVQDLGRPGFAAMGVSSAGAADRCALQTGNRLVGNAATTAGLESFGGGITLSISGHGVAAVTGAQATITVTSAAGSVYRHHLGEAFSLEDGDELELGPTTRGTRTYVAFRGGIEVETALGSASADTLAGLGPARLDVGTRIALAHPGSAPDLVIPNLNASGLDSPRATGSQRDLPTPGETIELSVKLGPREDWFTSAGVNTLLSQIWTVTHDSDRVGLRLAGEVPLERSRTGELPSEGAVTGALQVPPNGQPVLFGPDHPLTGGYPIIASVNDTDLAAQLAPGVRIHFVTDDAAATDDSLPSHTETDHSDTSTENGS